MTPHLITVYHNISGHFAPYVVGHDLVDVISHCRYLPEATDPADIADWMYHLLNAGLDDLEQARENSGGESAFLLACTYRLLDLRSLSTGDVVAITVAGRTVWLACEPVGWRRISTPVVPAGSPLSAAVGRRVRGARRG